jgi:hypothetical protein
LVVANALQAGRIVRVFEWINTALTPGHPHAFTAAQLDALLGGEGKTETLNGEGTCIGDCYYGIFKGEGYAEV